MEYINEAIEGEKYIGKLIRKMNKQSKVTNFLKSKGYKYIHFDSGYWTTEYNKYADINLGHKSYEHLVGFLDLFAKKSILLPFLQYNISEYSYKHLRARILFAFSELPKVHKIKEPKFIFTHIVSPHPPYVFGKKGEKISKKGWHNKELYKNQLIFLNKKIKALIDEILLKSEVPPIIVLQSDHGSESSFGRRGGENWIKPNVSTLRERMRNFSAFYLPQGGDSVLYDSITNVNTFRVIFNYYFDTNYELLDDKSYFSILLKKPFEFSDVTKKVMF